MRLYYTPGSPFARIIRVLIRELGLDCEESAITGFPPPTSYFAINPLGQVPALVTSDGVKFPTRIIIEHLLGCAGQGSRAVAPAIRREPANWQDDQTLTVLLAMGDALAALKYQQWAGLRPGAENLIGYDPADRQAERVVHTLDWLESRCGEAGFLPDVMSVQDIALACILLWVDARGGFPWRGREKIEAIVAVCAPRPSFADTRPQPWP